MKEQKEVNNKNIIETKKFTIGDKVKIEVNINKDLNDTNILDVKDKVYIIINKYTNDEYLVASQNEKYKLKGESLEIVK